MTWNKKWVLAAGLAATVLLGWGARAHADEVNYYFPPGYYPPGPVYSPYGGGPAPIVIIADDFVTWDSRYDESPWERRERQTFHPGYQSWSDYYESPPWHHRNENDFNPWWTY